MLANRGSLLFTNLLKRIIKLIEIVENQPCFLSFRNRLLIFQAHLFLTHQAHLFLTHLVVVGVGGWFWYLQKQFLSGYLEKFRYLEAYVYTFYDLDLGILEDLFRLVILFDKVQVVIVEFQVERQGRISSSKTIGFLEFQIQIRLVF